MGRNISRAAANSREREVRSGVVPEAYFKSGRRGLAERGSNSGLLVKLACQREWRD
jgi:hypothetical protein